MTKQTTHKGTPCAKSWDDQWIEIVNTREAQLRRNICGARTLNATPCTIESDHPSGRCKHHGGFNLTGAPKGNRNATIHGLYAQRLATCGKHCPMWKRCPLASEAVLTPRPQERPHCPYEQQIFEATLTSEIGETASWGDTSSPLDYQLAHIGALHAVMLWRATAAMAEAPLIQTHPQKNNQPPTYGRIHPYTEAYCRISREHERWRRFMETRRKSRKHTTECAILPTPHPADHATQRQHHDTTAAPQEILQQEPNSPPKVHAASTLLDIATAATQRGDVGDACTAITRAQMLDQAQANLAAERFMPRLAGSPLHEKYLRERLNLPQTRPD